jgi:uncharacterized protein (DUF427 family)
MTNRPILTPGPDHPITIESGPKRVQVRSGDALIADSTTALALSEADYPVVQYIPRADADMTQLQRSTHASYCPYKGEAAYFDIPALGDGGRNAVWTYEQPHTAVAEIAGHLAFYPSKVEIAQVAEQAAQEKPVLQPLI